MFISLITESPIKKSRLKEAGEVCSSGDNEMEVQESVDEPEKNEDLEMDVGEDSSHKLHPHQPQIYQG